MSDHSDIHNDDSPIPHDELDTMLRQWHQVNAQRVRHSRAALIEKLASTDAAHGAAPIRSVERTGSAPLHRSTGTISLHRFFANRYVRAAASIAILIAGIALFMPIGQTPALAAQREIMVPDGGRLDARDDRGNLIGPCPLAHTDVHINVTGPFTRVNVKQQYHNPYADKIEAVYTFPLSHRAAVDRMTMTVGDRVIEAEMKERQQARQIYESARTQGYVAGLLEQERPNIFTQSVANIEPGADITIDISYVEMLQSRDGVYSLAFPMVVAPRYIPGYALNKADDAGNAGGGAVNLPGELERRRGVILLGPAMFERVDLSVKPNPNGQGMMTSTKPLGSAPFIGQIIDSATPILPPPTSFRQRPETQALVKSGPSINFTVAYADGSNEFGQIAGDGLGHINGRWFFVKPALIARLEREHVEHPDRLPAPANVSAAGFNADTNQVPDASRITPRPTRPPMRAGHDISVSVAIDTGGPAIIDYKSDLHEIVCTDGPQYKNLGNKIHLALKDQHEIPNRDFVLSWRTMDDRIQEATFVHVDAKPRDDKGGFFTAIIAPPARVDSDSAMPRELIFVLDTSGSMEGLPLDKAKAVMSKAIEAMRPRDTFNMITFSGDTHILWEAPRPNTVANRAEAQNFLASRSGGGGTEMMTAINAALAPSPANANAPLSPEALANLPADGREVAVRAAFSAIEAEIRKNAIMNPMLKVRDGLEIRLSPFQLPLDAIMHESDVVLRGKWATVSGERILQLASAEVAPPATINPMRIVMFLTDGLVGNDDAIIQAVRDNARTTRVFSFGVGDSPNRSLLDSIAQAGRGDAEYVNLNSNPDAAVERFTKRIGTPVLADIHLSFSDNLRITDTVPPLDGPGVPDLFDVKPLIIHGRFLPISPSIEGGGQGVGEARGAADARGSKGTLTITGTTGAGPYHRTIDLDLTPKPADGGNDDDHAVIATLWARAKVDELLRHPADGHMQSNVIALGEQYSIMTPYTSFVAVEKARLTIAGRNVLVPVPIELPEGMKWEGVWGEISGMSRQAMIDRVRSNGIEAAMREVYSAQKALRYDDALKVLGAILEVEPANQAALAMRDVINTRQMYRDYKRDVPGLASPDVAGRFGWKAQVGSVLTFNSDSSLQEQGLTNQFADTDGGEQTGQQFTGRVELPILLNGRSSQSGSRNPGADEVWYGYSATSTGHVTWDATSSGTFVNNSVLLLGDIPTTGVAFGAPPTPTNGAIAYGRVEFSGAPSLDLNSAIRTVSSGGVGGGGGGAGRGLFGKPRSEPERLSPSAFMQTASTQPDSPEPPVAPERVWNQVFEIILETIHPEDWDDVGGELANLRVENGRFIFTALKDDPASHQVVDDARAFLAYLQNAIPMIKAAVTIDVPASHPFQDTESIRIYDIGDVFNDAKASQAEIDRSLADLIEETVDPEGWTANGGTRSGLMSFGGFFIVRAPVEVHRAIKDLLVKILRAEPTVMPIVSLPVNVDAPATSEGYVTIYSIRDLTGTVAYPAQMEMAKQIVDIITSNVDPEGWTSNGGNRGSIQEFAGKLIVTTTQNNHQDIQGLLRQLREVRSQPDALVNSALTQSANVGSPAGSTMENPKSEPPKPPESPDDRRHRIIDPRLWDLALDNSRSSAADVRKAVYASKSSGTNDEVAVVLSVRDVQQPVLYQLTAAGLAIDDVAKSTKVIAGRIAANKLADLAMLETVRRIEPLVE